MSQRNDLTGKRFGRLTAISDSGKRKNGRIVWKCCCDCGNTTDVVSSYLTSGETRSCGCLKKEKEADNLRNRYDSRYLFKGAEPRRDSSTGYRGVSCYLTRVSKELRYRAWITVDGKRHYKSGFLTAEAAYFEGRLQLEKDYLR